MERKYQLDPVVLFASRPDLKVLCMVTVRVENVTAVPERNTTQPRILKCRELIFTEPEILASPSPDQFDCFDIVMNQNLFKTGRVQARLKSNKLNFSKPNIVSPGTYQACLQYTLLAKLAPAWNKAGDWLIQGRDFVSHRGCANAVKCEIHVNAKELYVSLNAAVLKLVPLQLTDLNLSDLELQSLLYDAEHHSGELPLQNFWCKVMPSMKRGRLCSISLSIPEGSPFTSYRDLRRHWKNSYGYRLPETDEDIFYGQISFWGMSGKQFTYPSVCLRAGPLQSVPRVEPKPILSAFLQAVHGKVPAACGQPLTFQPQLRHTMAALHAAAEEVKGPGPNLSKHRGQTSRLPLRNPLDLVIAPTPSTPHSSSSEVAALKSSIAKQRTDRAQQGTSVAFVFPLPSHPPCDALRSSQSFSLTQTGPQLSQDLIPPTQPRVIAMSKQSSRVGQGWQSSWQHLPSSLSSQRWAPTSASGVTNKPAGGSRAPELQSPQRSATGNKPAAGNRERGLSRDAKAAYQSEPLSGNFRPSPFPSGQGPANESERDERKWEHFGEGEYNEGFLSHGADQSASVPTAYANIAATGSGTPPRRSLSLKKRNLPMLPTDDKLCHGDKTTISPEKESQVQQREPGGHQLQHGEEQLLPQKQHPRLQQLVDIYGPVPNAVRTAGEDKNGTDHQSYFPGLASKTLVPSAMTSHRGPRDEAESLSATGPSEAPPRRFVPIFKPKIVSSSSAGGAGVKNPEQPRGNSAATSKGSKIVPTFKPKIARPATTKFGMSGEPSKPTVATTCPLAFSCPTLTSTDHPQSSSRQPAFPVPRPPTFPSGRKAQQPGGVVARSPRGLPSLSGVTNRAAPGTAVPIARKLKLKMEAAVLGLTDLSQGDSEPSSQPKRKQSMQLGGDGGEKKPRNKPQVQDVDVAMMARSDQLGKVNTVTLISWLKQKGVQCKAKDKKSDLVDKVKVFLALTSAES